MTRRESPEGREYGRGVTDVAANVARVRERIAAATRRSGRRAEEVTLVAVTKGVDPPRILAAAACGVTDFGENRLQEAVPKITALRGQGLSTARWHLVGHLQRNKVRQAVAAFDVVHSVDGATLATALSQRAAAGDRVVDVLVQVNVGREPQKFGVAPDALPALLRAAAGLPALRVIGLMTIAPQAEDPQTTRPVFRQLRELRDDMARISAALSLVHLSMGMTDDFEIAVEEGATIVRIGRAIFGPRSG